MVRVSGVLETLLFLSKSAINITKGLFGTPKPFPMLIPLLSAVNARAMCVTLRKLHHALICLLAGSDSRLAVNYSLD